LVARAALLESRLAQRGVVGVGAPEAAAALSAPALSGPSAGRSGPALRPLRGHGIDQILRDETTPDRGVDHPGPSVHAVERICEHADADIEVRRRLHNVVGPE